VSHSYLLYLVLLLLLLHCLQYLVESIRMFPKQQQLEDIMSDAGFKVVSHTDLTFGAVSVHSGFKL
jgi:2-methoxy-6-polyprenyl-1,4-benzoquinol methylase